MARLEAALREAGLTLDERDMAAALRVHIGLERARALLKADEVAPDEPG
ncbi:hypothetical protein [Paracoccus sediminicola]|nr:hypothetical protein [Paracoccus sediminicola]WBU55718.1 hypothetical protein PAF18_09275 [Paracoccus sediminicola]